jgi:hypothetical protein
MAIGMETGIWTLEFGFCDLKFGNWTLENGIFAT